MVNDLFDLSHDRLRFDGSKNPAKFPELMDVCIQAVSGAARIPGPAFGYSAEEFDSATAGEVARANLLMNKLIGSVVEREGRMETP
jgi:hypothetical protein